MVIIMQALIDTSDSVKTGYRVAQVVPDGGTFPVADTLFWTACPNYVVADQYWYDPADQQFKQVSETSLNQPTTTGAQTL
jgi:hypothetical protein